MATEVVFLKKLFEVIGHTDHIELRQTLRGVDTCGVDISVNDSLIVHVG